MTPDRDAASPLPTPAVIARRCAALPFAQLVLAVAVALGCSGDDDGADPEGGGAKDAAPPDGAGRGTDAGRDAAQPPGQEDHGEALFDPEHLLQIDIELAEADWDAIRYEGRSVAEVFGNCSAAFEYTRVPAVVTIDGEVIRDVAVRKKGYVGSLSSVRPSLKLDFDEYVPGRRYGGMKGMTLNNNRQDPSNTHQCMAYAVFAAAGVPSPRCNFARVTVNGRDLGIYSHVEAIKKPFLARHFASDDGDLYEGQGADFRAGFRDKLEFKGDPGQADPAQVDAVVEALLASDDALLDALEPLVDLERFISFWASEVLVSHWDGYTGDLNNFYAYFEPGGALQFIPWGTDGAFEKHAFLPASAPRSVWAVSALSRRLYDHAPSRERYRARLQALLDDVWDERALLDEVDRIAALTSADEASADAQRAFIRSRRGQLQAELDRDAPPWRYPERTARGCADRSVPAEATFDTTYRDLEQSLSPGATLELPLGPGMTTPAFSAVLSSAGPSTDRENPGPAVRVLGVLADGSYLLAQMQLGPQPLAPGEIPLHGLETSGVVLRGQGSDYTVLGLLVDGTLTLEEGSTQPGDRVRGRFEARFVPLNLGGS